MAISLWSSSYGQSFGNETVVFESDLFDTLSVNCNGNFKSQYRNIRVYTTTNNRINGPLSSECFFDIEAAPFGSGLGFTLDDSLENKTVFIETSLPNISFKLDSLYEIRFDSYRRNCRIASLKNELIIEKWDSLKQELWMDTVLIQGYESCYLGSKFHEVAKKSIVSVAFQDISSNALAFSLTGIYRQLNAEIIKDSLKADYAVSDEVHQFSYIKKGEPLNRIFSNPDSSRSSTTVNIIEVFPAEPVNQRITIDMNSWRFGGIFIQPYVKLRGSVFDSLKDIRHQLRLNIEEGSFCISAIVDLVSSGDDEVLFNGGKLHMMGPRSCLMFEDSSQLVIGEGQDFIYGENGKGILGLKPGARINLRDKAKLTINNHLVLADYIDGQGGEASITLKHGQKLSFGEKSLISNGPFEHGRTKLKVILAGGELDISSLSEKERSLLIIERNDRLYQNLEKAEIYPNPVRNELFLSFEKMESVPTALRIVNIQGSIISETVLNSTETIAKIKLNTEGLKPGIYFLQVQSSKGVFSKKFLKAAY